MMAEIIPYMPRGSYKTESIRGKAYQVWSTRQEDSFRIAIMEQYTPLFDSLLADDDFLRVWFFLERGVVFESPLGSVGFPLLIDPDMSFIDSLLKSGELQKTQDIYKGKMEDMMMQFEQFSMGLMTPMFRFMFSKPEVRRLFRMRQHKKKSVESHVLEKAISGHEKEFEEPYREFMKLVPKAGKVLRDTLPRFEAYQNLEKGLKNYELLCFAFEEFKTKWKDSLHSIGKLVARGGLNIRLRSVCLECEQRKGLEPFVSELIHPGTWIAQEKCLNCGGKTILHNLILEVPDPLKLMVEEYRIPEFTIGYALARLKPIRKIYIHKKVKAIENGVSKPSVEIDVFAVTDDGGIIIIEVTKSRDMTNVMKAVGSKLKNLSQNGIPYDLFVYVSGMENPNPIPYEEKVKVFGIRQVATMEHQMRKLLG